MFPITTRSITGRNRILDWAEILMGIEDNSDRYAVNAADYVDDGAGYEALLQNLAEGDGGGGGGGGGRRGAPPAAKSAIALMVVPFMSPVSLNARRAALRIDFRRASAVSRRARGGAATASPVSLAPGALHNMAEDNGGIPVSGTFALGQFVDISLTFDNGQTSNLSVPVVANDGQWAGLASATPSPVATPGLVVSRNTWPAPPVASSVAFARTSRSMPSWPK